MVTVYNNLGIAWATSLFAFIALAMMPIPWVLFKWGPTIRKRSLLTLKIFDDEQAEGRDTVCVDGTV